jgi:hypothetical protein
VTSAKRTLPARCADSPNSAMAISPRWCGSVFTKRARPSRS